MRRTLLALAILATPALSQPRITILDSDDPALRLGGFTFEGGRTLDLRIGIGSAAHRRIGDPEDVVYFLSDRGPNIACSDIAEIAGVPRNRICAAANNGRVYPLPSYTPSIYGVQLDRARNTFRLFETIAIKTRGGRPTTGLTNPLGDRTDVPLDGAGNMLPQDPNALDAEGLFRLPNGWWWIGEENMPSLALLSPDGRIQRRIVPVGTSAEIAGADYRVEEGLPAVAARRQSNRGIESMTGAPDGRTLFFILQNPLANPNAAAFRAARNTRLFRFDPQLGRATAQFVYQLEPPRAFQADPSDDQSRPRISEMLWLSENRLLVLERTDVQTKLFVVTLTGATDILGGRWDDPATAPSLEQTTDLAAAGIVPVTKRLVFDSANHEGIPGKVEGLALLADGTLLMVNDDDFGITGERTRIVLVQGLDLLRD
jgi:hypothetical protein